MIYYPNNLERYTAALRLLYQKLIIKNGIKDNYLISLKIIYEFVALNNTEIKPINPEKLCGELLTAAFLKNKNDFYINTKNNYIINKKCFLVLILNILTTTDYIEIFEINNNLVIKGKFKITNKINLFLKKLGGKIFKDVKNKIHYLKFDFPVTQKESEDFESAYYLLQNPLSVINLYLNG